MKRTQVIRHATTVASAVAILAMSSAIGEPVAAEESLANDVMGFDIYSGPDRIHLLWGKRSQDNSIELLHQHTDDGEHWSQARPVDLGDRAVFNVHPGNEPRIAAAGDEIVALWTMPGNAKFGSGPLAAAYSNDGGQSWRAGNSPSDIKPEAAGGQGFIDIVAGPDGAFHATWIDDRDDDRGLRTATSSDGGRTWSANATVDAATCQCCWNDIEPVPGSATGLSILYRDRGPRDMRMAVRSQAGADWEQRGIAGDFNWQIDGCPHVGGSIAYPTATNPDDVSAVVWTGHDDTMGAYIFRSLDAGRHWSQSRALGTWARHTDMIASDNVLYVVWDEKIDGGARVIKSAQSVDQGATWSEPQLLSAPDARATHPRLAARGDQVLALWLAKSPDGNSIAAAPLTLTPGM